MKKYSVTAKVSALKCIGEFEAESKAAAVQLAMRSDAAYVLMCHQFSEQFESPSTDFFAEEVEE